MPDDLMESIEPFDISEAVDFQTAYLAGYLANLNGITRSGLSAPANFPVKTTGLSQNGHLVAAIVASPTISPPQD